MEGGSPHDAGKELPRPRAPLAPRLVAVSRTQFPPSNSRPPGGCFLNCGTLGAGRIAQWPEQLVYIQTVGGSTPSAPTTTSDRHHYRCTNDEVQREEKFILSLSKGLPLRPPHFALRFAKGFAWRANSAKWDSLLEIPLPQAFFRWTSPEALPTWKNRGFCAIL